MPPAPVHHPFDLLAAGVHGSRWVDYRFKFTRESCFLVKDRIGFATAYQLK